jgi:hypothetical protein
MTQDDLDKLKDVTELQCAIYQGEQDGMVQDIYGVWWLTGQLRGEPVKRRLHGASISSYSPLSA